MTTKRGGVPTLTAAAQAVVDAWEGVTDEHMTALRAARRTRRVRGASAAELAEPVTPTPLRANR
jgi:hypothetical protein